MTTTPTTQNNLLRGAQRRYLCVFLFAMGLLATSQAFSITPRRSTTTSTTSLNGYNSVYTGKSYNRPGRGSEKSKRQERVGHLVQTELSRILHTGNIKGHDVEFLDDELRQRISIVSSDVSPDLRQARISVSIRASSPKEVSESPAVDRRRAYAWLVRNTKNIRHTLAQRLSHMKACPDLSFNQVDVSAAVDVMYLIDKLSTEDYKRKNLNLFDEDDVASGIVGGMDFDEELEDDDDWEEDDNFFEK